MSRDRGREQCARSNNRADVVGKTIPVVGGRVPKLSFLVIQTRDVRGSIFQNPIQSTVHSVGEDAMTVWDFDSFLQLMLHVDS